jgi:hypothetical protein
MNAPARSHSFNAMFYLFQNQGPVSQQAWHDKDPYMLKGPEHIGMGF